MRRSSDRATAARLSLVLFALFIPFGVFLPFFSVWLDRVGLTTREIAVIQTLPLIAAMISGPFATAIADRTGRIARILAFAAVGGAAAAAALSMTRGFVAIFVATLIFSLFRTAQTPLGDALLIAAARERPGLDYGRIRLWGSAAVLVAMLAGGFLVEAFGADRIDLLIFLSMAAGALAALAEASRDRGAAPRPAVAAGNAPNMPRALVLTLIAAALIQASHADLYAFASLDWQARGVSRRAIGALWALGVLAEILFFAFAARLIDVRGRAPALLIAGGLAAALRWIVMSLDPPEALLWPLQTTHALSFGATHLGAVALLADRAPERLRSRAQGWHHAVVAGATGLATAACGPLVEAFGPRAYVAMAGLAGAGALAASLIASSRRLK